MRIKDKRVALLIMATLVLGSLSACSRKVSETSEPSVTEPVEVVGQEVEIEPVEILDLANDEFATLRQSRLSQTAQAPVMSLQSNSDLRSVRNYPEQPPVIPHETEDYQVDRRANQCLDCHSRTAIAVSQAPMVSISHFMDREGQFLASISPRRYFCNQCHVSQNESAQLVENTFVDVDTLIQADARRDR